MPAAAGTATVAVWVVALILAGVPTTASSSVTAICKDVKAAGCWKSVNVTVSACAVAAVKENSDGWATLGKPTKLVSSSSTSAPAVAASSGANAAMAQRHLINVPLMSTPLLRDCYDFGAGPALASLAKLSSSALASSIPGKFFPECSDRLKLSRAASDSPAEACAIPK